MNLQKYSDTEYVKLTGAPPEGTRAGGEGKGASRTAIVIDMNITHFESMEDMDD